MNTENGATFPELLDKLPILGKKAEEIIVSNWEKGKSKTKRFSKIIEVDEPDTSIKSEPAEPE